MVSDKTGFLTFDMDGLFMDMERVYLEGRLYALNKQQVAIAEAVVKGQVRRSFHGTYTYLVQVCYEEVLCAGIHKDREQYIYQCLENGMLSVTPYTRDTLRAVQEYGHRTGLATPPLRRRSTVILAYLDLLPYFDAPVLADNVTELKPHPSLYLEVLRRARVPYRHAAASEDFLTGVQVAVMAGIQIV